MFHLKNKIISKVIIFAIITILVLWLIPAGTVFGEEGTGTPDTTSPVTTLLGDNPVTVEVDSTYTDAGATASDEVDGDLTDSIEVVDNVDTSTVGSYDVTYNVSDAAGNAADEVVRAVEVVEASQGTGETDTSDTGDQEATDTTSPVTTLLGDNPVTVEVDSTYTDAGATASDEVDGDLTDSIEVVDNVDTSTVGSYDVTYNVSDAAGNAADEVVRAVEVIGVTEVATSVFLNPVISTDKDDYAPGETVIISGFGFASFTNYTIVVTPLGSEFTPSYLSIITDASGSFNGLEYPIVQVTSLYNVKAIDESGNTVATTSFTDCHQTIFLNKTGLEGTTLTASFQLWKNGTTAIGTPQEANSGNGWSINWADQTAGTYTVTETSGATGYSLVSITPASIMVTEANYGDDANYPDSYFTFTAVNEPNTGSIVVTKSGMETGDLVSITLKKGAAVWETKTDVGNGTHTFSGLPYGTDYSIIETYSGGNTYSYGVAIQSPDDPLTVDSQTPVAVSLTNVPEKGYIGLIKYVDDGRPPDGSSFSIDWLGSDAKSGVIVLDQSNTWEVTNFELFKGITYIFSEQDPGGSGFVKIIGNDSSVNANSFSFTAVIDDNGQISFYNKAGTITVTKKDVVDKSVLAGAVFGLFTDSEGTLQAYDAWGNAVPNKTSGTDGKVVFTGLKAGTYWVKELSPPTGYGLAPAMEVTIGCSNTKVAFEVTSVDSCIWEASIDYEDPRLPGQFRLMKVNSVTNLPVPGAKYNIYDSGSNLVEIVTTQSDGWAAVTIQNWGTYTVKETFAPAGYSLDLATYSVTFDANHIDQVLYVKDTPTTTTTTVTVAGLTEGIQVLAFTGIDPIIPIAGGSAVIAGLAMFLATLRRRVSRK